MRSRWFRRIPWIGLAAALFLIAGYAAVALLAAHLLTRSQNRVPNLDPRLIADHPVRWRTRTADGLTLRGWYYPAAAEAEAEDAPLIVGVHGMDGCWTELAGIGRDLHRRGYALLLFDLRGHGESDPARLTMGRRERADLRAVMAWANAEGYPPDRIGWVANSMGAATVLMEGGSNEDIRAAVLDSPYSDLPALLNQQLSIHSHLPRCFNPGILLAARLVYGVRTDDIRPGRWASRWRDRPLFVIHGEGDSIVPVEQSREIARNAGPRCKLVTLPGVEHTQAYWASRHGYVQAVDRFFQGHLNAGRQPAARIIPASMPSGPRRH